MGCQLIWSKVETYDINDVLDLYDLNYNSFIIAMSLFQFMVLLVLAVTGIALT
jgi:hypothetical protein